MPTEDQPVGPIPSDQPPADEARRDPNDSANERLTTLDYFCPRQEVTPTPPGRVQLVVGFILVACGLHCLMGGRIHLTAHIDLEGWPLGIVVLFFGVPVLLTSETLRDGLNRLRALDRGRWIFSYAAILVG